VHGVQERGTAPPLSEAASSAPGTRRRLTVALSVAACVVAADQLTKSWAVSRLSHGEIHVFWKLDFVLQYNTGSSFSLLQGWAPVLGGVAVVVVFVMLVMVRHASSDGVAAVLGLVVGGALGNLSDRVFRSHHGAVVDFIALHFWPTFNVADACIVTGGILLVFLLWRSRPARPDESNSKTIRTAAQSGHEASPQPGNDEPAAQSGHEASPQPGNDEPAAPGHVGPPTEPVGPESG
jgi:signal peptidase II